MIVALQRTRPVDSDIFRRRADDTDQARGGRQPVPTRRQPDGPADVLTGASRASGSAMRKEIVPTSNASRIRRSRNAARTTITTTSRCGRQRRPCALRLTVKLIQYRVATAADIERGIRRPFAMCRMAALLPSSDTARTRSSKPRLQLSLLAMPVIALPAVYIPVPRIRRGWRPHVLREWTQRTCVSDEAGVLCRPHPLRG